MINRLEGSSGDDDANGWQPIDIDNPPKSSKRRPIRIKAEWFDNPNNVVIAKGWFGEDGFYLVGGGELAFERTPIAWQPLSA